MWTNRHNQIVAGLAAAMTAVATGVRGVVGLVSELDTNETVRSSAKVHHSAVDLVMTMHTALNWGWLVFTAFALTGAVLLLRRGTGHFVLLWPSAVIGFPLVFFSVNLPSAAAAQVSAGAASAAAAIMLFVAVLTWPEDRITTTPMGIARQ